MTKAGPNIVSVFGLQNGAMVTKRVVFVATGLISLPGAATALWAQTGGFAYVVNGGGNNSVSAYSIDATSGALTPVPGSPFLGAYK